MSEKRQPEARILLKNGRGPNVRLELYRSELWGGAPAGCWRLRLNGRWVGGKSFHDAEELGVLLHVALFKALGFPVMTEPQRTQLPKGSRVKVPYRKIGDKIIWESTFTRSGVLRDEAGHEVVMVSMINGARLVRVADIQIVEGERDGQHE